MAEYNGDSMSFGQRIKHAWNAFIGRDQTRIYAQDLGPSYVVRQDRIPMRKGTERSIVASIYTRIAIDVSAVRMEHARMDEDGRYMETVDSGLNYCLNTEANIDQSGRDFIQDLVETLCDEGTAAIVPTETTLSPLDTGGYDVKSMRVGRVTEWRPEHVKVSLYSQWTGKREEIILPKSVVAIVQNPLYNVMNEPNGILRRLIRKLNLLDAIDEQAGSGKLDMLLQMPFGTRTEMRKHEAENRRKELENQLAGSKYGIGYIDVAEKVIQLNRPVDNNLMAEIEYLTSMLYSQLGMTKEVFEGTADEKVMLNYFARSVEPFAAAITGEMNRKFLTRTARSQNQKIVFFRDLFKLAPMASIVTLGKELTTVAVVSPNEVRQMIGMKPSSDEGADELRNRYVDSGGANASAGNGGGVEEAGETQDHGEGSGKLGELVSRLR